MSRGILRFALALASVSFALPAAAHISLDRGGTHKSRYGDSDSVIKTAPCGKGNGTRGTNVYTYEPGQTITVKFLEFVPHPGYFRFAFDNEGDNDFVTPKSIKPVDPKRACPSNSADQCGKSDFYNSPTVLPNMDNLDPHLAGDTKMYTYQVKLPDVECTNCTLQLIQVMEDLVHGPYTPGPGTPGDLLYISDVYYQCIDLVLKRGAGTGSGGAAGSGGATGAGGATGSGGTLGTGGTVGAGGLVPMGGAVNAGGMTAGTGGTPGGLGGSMTGTGGATLPATGGATTASGGLPGATGGALGTGATPLDADNDEESGCAVGGKRTPWAGWLAVASALALAWTARRRSRRA